MSKYEALRAYLRGQDAETVPMSFAEIEKVLGFNLPKSQSIRAWWSNNPTNNVMTNEWLAAGYKTEQVDIEGRKLVFRRTRGGPNGGRDGGNQVPPTGDKPKHSRRHPLIGWMKGMTTIAPGTDLTEPADPDWADIAWGKEPESKKGKAGKG